jgi:hypothetical protein
MYVEYYRNLGEGTDVYVVSKLFNDNYYFIYKDIIELGLTRLFTSLFDSDVDLMEKGYFILVNEYIEYYIRQ